MPDPLQDAIELVDQVSNMPVSASTRYLLDRYRVSDTDCREAIVLALAAALITNRLQHCTAERIAAKVVSAAA